MGYSILALLIAASYCIQLFYKYSSEGKAGAKYFAMTGVWRITFAAFFLVVQFSVALAIPVLILSLVLMAVSVTLYIRGTDIKNKLNSKFG